jgi:hypothetical protein
MTFAFATTYPGAPRLQSTPERKAAMAPSAVRLWFAVMLFASIFLQRLALPGSNVGLNLLFTVVGLTVLGARGALIIDPTRAALLLLFAACVSISTLLNADLASLQSAGLILVLYLPFVASVRRPENVFRDCIDTFQNMTLLCAVVGILQYAVQFFVHSDLLFTFRGLLPDSILLTGFDNIIPLYYGSTIYKSNGFFFVEPSTFSQYMALAIVFELIFHGTTLRLAPYALALALSHSGTGLILLGIMLPLVLLHRRAYGAVAGLAVLAAIVIATGDVLHMDATVSRVGEFGSQESSAHARFIAGFVLSSQYLLSRPIDVLFGLGPGTFMHYAHTVTYEAHDLTLIKLLFEYGMVGSSVFWLLFAVSVFGGAPSVWVSTALTIGFLVFGAMVLDPRMQAILLVFCVLTKRQQAASGRVQHTPMAFVGPS